MACNVQSLYILSRVSVGGGPVKPLPLLRPKSILGPPSVNVFTILRPMRALPFYHFRFYQFAALVDFTILQVVSACGAVWFNAPSRFSAPTGFTILPSAFIFGPVCLTILPFSAPLSVIPFYHFNQFLPFWRIIRDYHFYKSGLLYALPVLTHLPIFRPCGFYHFTIRTDLRRCRF